VPEEGRAFDDASVDTGAHVLDLEREDATDEVWVAIDVLIASHGRIGLAEVLEVVLADKFLRSAAESVDIEVGATLCRQEEVVVLAVDARETSIELRLS